MQAGLQMPLVLLRSTHGPSRFRSEATYEVLWSPGAGGLSDRCSRIFGDPRAAVGFGLEPRQFRYLSGYSLIETPYQERPHSLAPWPKSARRYEGRSAPRPTRLDSSRARGLEMTHTVRPGGPFRPL